MNEPATLFVNGNILTLDRFAPHAEALLARDGRIVALGPGSETESQASPATRRIDLGGRTVVPGFNDCHCHILGFGLTLDQIDVGTDAARNIGDIQHLVEQRARQTAEGAWVLGRGYDQNVLQEGRHPTCNDLDGSSHGHPVLLWHTSGHALSCNSSALELAVVHAGTSTPPGGDIERDEHGEPTGVLKESATDLVFNVVPPPAAEQGAEAIIRAMKVMASQGITSASDASTGTGSSIDPELDMYHRAATSGRLRGRITVMPQIRYVAPPDTEQIREPRSFLSGQETEWLRVGPTKLFSDGALTTRTAALREPYTDTAGDGLMMWETPTLDSMIRRAHQGGWQIATHAIGDRAVEIVLDCYARALRETPRRDHRHRIEHCMLLDRELAARIQQLGIVPVLQPGFVSRLGDAYVTGLGMERASQLMPVALFDQLNITVAFSSDRPVIPGAPLDGIRAAVQRLTPAGATLGREHCVSALEAIRHYTMGSAYATHADSEVGALRRGSFADFTVLSDNPAGIPAGELAGVRVEMTVAGGVETYGE
ncbi:MAG: amidohydrolase [Chloroflexota bacterium]|nr:MAG: amidohydrolase [Chloroflexota bacterium]